MAVVLLTDEERQRILDMHAAGKSRNEIARELGRSGSTISNAVKAAGHTFARGDTVKAATEAKVLDAKERRAQLQLDLLAKAEKLLAQIDAPTTAFSFGGKNNSYNEREIPEPTFPDKRNIVQAIATAVNASIAIDRHDKQGDNLSAIDAWVANMMGNGQ